MIFFAVSLARSTRISRMAPANSGLILPRNILILVAATVVRGVSAVTAAKSPCKDCLSAPEISVSSMSSRAARRRSSVHGYGTPVLGGNHPSRRAGATLAPVGPRPSSPDATTRPHAAARQQQ
jgi:hypothetical protein